MDSGMDGYSYGTYGLFHSCKYPADPYWRFVDCAGFFGHLLVLQTYQQETNPQVIRWIGINGNGQTAKHKQECRLTYWCTCLPVYFLSRAPLAPASILSRCCFLLSSIPHPYPHVRVQSAHSCKSPSRFSRSTFYFLPGNSLYSSHSFSRTSLCLSLCTL